MTAKMKRRRDYAIDDKYTSQEEEREEQKVKEQFNFIELVLASSHHPKTALPRSLASPS